MIPVSTDNSFYRKLVGDVATLALLCSVFPIIYSTSHVRPASESILLAVLLTIASVLLGVRVTLVRHRIREQGELSSRGKLSVRGTGLVLRNVCRFEQRISELLARHLNSAGTREVVQSNLEEAILTCRGIREEGFEAVENWADLFPEANGRARIAGIDSTLVKLAQAKRGLAEAKGELSSSRIQGDVHEKLSRRLGQKQQQVDFLEEQLIANSASYDRSVLGGLHPITQKYSMVRAMSPEGVNFSAAGSTFQEIFTGQEPHFTETKGFVTWDETKGGKGRVLVVQSELAEGANVSQMVADLGYNVTKCTDGQQALKVAASDSFDVILVDVIIPKIRGLELIGKLREKGVKAKCVLMTGCTTGGVELNVIQKPFDAGALERALTNSLKENSGKEA